MKSQNLPAQVSRWKITLECGLKDRNLATCRGPGEVKSIALKLLCLILVSKDLQGKQSEIVAVLSLRHGQAVVNLNRHESRDYPVSPAVEVSLKRLQCKVSQSESLEFEHENQIIKSPTSLRARR
jgi:hypothetical protein